MPKLKTIVVLLSFVSVCQAKDIGTQIDPADYRTVITYTNDPCPIHQAYNLNYLYAYKVRGEFMGCVSQEIDTGTVIFFRKDGVMFKHSQRVLELANATPQLPTFTTPPSLTDFTQKTPIIQCFANGFGTITCSPL